MHFCQVPISKNPLARTPKKYCDPMPLCSPITRRIMGMPGSEAAFKVLSSVMGSCMDTQQKQHDLYAVGNSVNILLYSWQKVLNLLDIANLKLAAKRTICSVKTGENMLNAEAPIEAPSMTMTQKTGHSYEESDAYTSPQAIGVISRESPQVDSLRNQIIRKNTMPECSCAQNREQSSMIEMSKIYKFTAC